MQALLVVLHFSLSPIFPLALLLVLLLLLVHKEVFVANHGALVVLGVANSLVEERKSLGDL